MKLKKIKNYQKILILLFIITNILLMKLSYIREKNNYQKQNKLKIEKLIEYINLKLEVLSLSLNELENSKEIQNYDEKESQYTKLQAFQNIKDKNNFYGKFGYTISLGKEDSDVVLFKNGSISKNELFNMLNFNKNKIKKGETLISEEENNFNFLIKNDRFKKDDLKFWIVNLDKKIFFNNFLEDSNNNWFLEKNGKLYSLTDSKIDKKLDTGDKIFKNSFFNFNILYKAENEHLNIILINELLKIFFVTLFMYLLIIYVIKVLEKPILNLAKKVGYSTKSNEISDKSGEIKFIEEKIDELYLEKAFLNSKIDDLSVIGRRKNLRDYILGIREIDDISQLTRKINSLKGKKLNLVLIEIYDTDNDDLAFDNFFLGRDYLKGSFLSEGSCEYLDVDYKSLLFIIPEEDENILEDGFEYILKNIEEKYSVDLVASVSRDFYELENLPQEYINCKKTLDMKFLFTMKKVLFYNRIDKSNLSVVYPIEREGRLASKILSGNIIGTKKIIDEIFQDIEENLDKNKVKILLGLLYNTLDRILLQISTFKNEKNLDIDLKVLLKETSVEKIKLLFTNLATEICKLKDVSEDTDMKNIREKIQKYILENYQKDFSLDDLADFLGFSFRYTSILFKKVIGDNFKNYLSRYRIEKAKEIMKENPNIKVKELAELVGCNSSNTFIRVFKKYEGTSPAKYYQEEK